MATNPQIDESTTEIASIYGLFDRHGKLRYIGKANDPKKRLASHMRDARRRDTPLYRWIRKNGLPKMVVLIENCTEWRKWEKGLIAEARAMGVKLLNVADGGDEPGCSIEIRRQNGRRTKGHPSYYSTIKHDQHLLNIFNLKREYPSLVRLYEKHGDTDGAERVRGKMRDLATKLPDVFWKWATI